MLNRVYTTPIRLAVRWHFRLLFLQLKCYSRLLIFIAGMCDVDRVGCGNVCGMPSKTCGIMQFRVRQPQDHQWFKTWEEWINCNREQWPFAKRNSTWYDRSTKIIQLKSTTRSIIRLNHFMTSCMLGEMTDLTATRCLIGCQLIPSAASTYATKVMYGRRLSLGINKEVSTAFPAIV